MTNTDAAGKATGLILDSLDKRMAKVYSSALEKAIKDNKGFFKLIQELDEELFRNRAEGWSEARIASYRKAKMANILRASGVVESIAKEMQKAGVSITPEIQAAMVDVYYVNRNFAGKTIAKAAKAAGYSAGHAFDIVPKREVKVILDSSTPVFSKIAYQNLGKNSQIVQKLQESMAQGVLLGESREKIIKRIQAITGQCRYQAKRVAQTESTRTSAQARMDSIKEAVDAGVVVKKKWVCNYHNSRDSHKDLGRKPPIPYDEPFRTIWGNTLMQPGDPNAPAKEVINCYCAIKPVVCKPED